VRLLDKILSEGFGTYDVLSDDGTKNTLECLRNSQLVVIDNVAEYFFTQRIDDFFSVSDFPCVMLPFELSFFEFRIPGRDKGWIGCNEVGVLLGMQKPDTRSLEYPEILGQPGVEFYLSGYYFIRQPGLRKTGLVAEFLLPVGKDGQIISPNNDKIHAVTNLFMSGLKEKEIEGNLKFIHQFVNFPTFLALSFMHCRNVTKELVEPPPKLSKSHLKKRGRPLLRYYVLQIDHMKSVLEHEGHAGTDGLKRALHICRGYFATYGKDGKGLLFGKLSGRYWIPMHVRGTAKEGVVVKDYDVK